MRLAKASKLFKNNSAKNASKIVNSSTDLKSKDENAKKILAVF